MLGDRLPARHGRQYMESTLGRLMYEDFCGSKANTATQRECFPGQHGQENETSSPNNDKTEKKVFDKVTIEP